MNTNNTNPFFIKYQYRLPYYGPISKTSGKHYAISDVHGKYGSYIEAINNLNNEDHLFILGDVIDRGNGGIQILKDIIERQKHQANNPKITFLLGNHEAQFIDAIKLINKNNLTKDFFEDISKISVDYLRFNILLKYPFCIQDFQNKDDYYHSIYEKYTTNTELAELDFKKLIIWIVGNHGNTTIFDYLNSTPDEQEEIYNFLHNAYVALPYTINNNDYLFVHSMPPNNDLLLHNMKHNKTKYTIANTPIQDYYFILEEKNTPTYSKAQKIGFTTICGHTPLLDGNIFKNPEENFIRIDTACGYGRFESKLSLYCIEDNSLIQIPEKEEIDIPKIDSVPEL